MFVSFKFRTNCSLLLHLLPTYNLLLVETIDNLRLHPSLTFTSFQPAAKRVIAYWEKRVGIFGDEKAFLPMTLSGALKGDERSLEIGYARPVFEKDDAGRAILFVDPARLPMDKTTFEPISMARAFWYYAHAVLEDEEVQKKGVVLVIYPKEAQRTQFNRKVFKTKIASMKGCLPMRVAAFHICHAPSFFENLFAVAKIFLGERLRKRVKMHSGSKEGVLDKLEKKFGIDRVKMPTQMGGGNDLDHMGWLEERMSSGL